MVTELANVSRLTATAPTLARIDPKTLPVVYRSATYGADTRLIAPLSHCTSRKKLMDPVVPDLADPPALTPSRRSRTTGI